MLNPQVPKPPKVEDDHKMSQSLVFILLLGLLWFLFFTSLFLFSPWCFYMFSNFFLMFFSHSYCLIYNQCWFFYYISGWLTTCLPADGEVPRGLVLSFSTILWRFSHRIFGESKPYIEQIFSVNKVSYLAMYSSCLHLTLFNYMFVQSWIFSSMASMKRWRCLVPVRVTMIKASVLSFSPGFRSLIGFFNDLSMVHPMESLSPMWYFLFLFFSSVSVDISGIQAYQMTGKACMLWQGFWFSLSLQDLSILW